MHRVTDTMRTQRKSLEGFLQSFLKDEQQSTLASQIHMLVASAWLGGDGITEVLAKLDQALQAVPVRTVTGDTLSGWTTRAKYLTERQRAQVLAAVKLVYDCGGRFDGYPPEA